VSKYSFYEKITAMVVDDNSFITFGISGMKLDYEKKFDCQTKGSVTILDFILYSWH
jgi:hypothetical protein